jgi:hypothetical protein
MSSNIARLIRTNFWLEGMWISVQTYLDGSSSLFGMVNVVLAVVALAAFTAKLSIGKTVTVQL